MRITAELIQDAAEEARRATRHPVRVGAGLRRQGTSGGTVHVTDLSISGFQAETAHSFHVGSNVWLKLPGLEALLARVAWSNGQRMGGEFHTPLHDATVERYARMG